MSSDLFISQQRSVNTARAYRQDLDRWDKFLAGREVTEELVLAFRELLETSLSNNSAVRAFNTIRAYHKWQGSGLFDRVKGPRRTQNWTPVSPPDRQVDALMAACTSDADRAIISLLACGLRAQEVCDLRTEDLTFVDDYNTWVMKVTGKGQKVRFVPLSTEAANMLESYRGDRDGKMFPKLTIRRVYYIVKEKYGTELHPHALRHNYATRLIRRGVDVFSVQKLLGHARADTTGIYVNLDLGDLVRASQLDTR